MLDLESVQAAVKFHFGLEVVKITPLGSCQDLNYKIRCTDSNSYVVKYTNPSVSIEDVHFQHNVKKYLQGSSSSQEVIFPSPVHRIDKPDLTTVEQKIGEEAYTLHVLSYVQGDLLSDFSYLHHDSLLEFGSKMAGLAQALSVYPNRIISRESEWDMKKSIEMCSKHAHSIPDEKERLILLNIVQQLFNQVQANSSSLRTQLIHGDLAPYNVIARKKENQRPFIYGVIDFGDIAHTWLVAEIAIAIAPMLSYTTNPILETIRHITAGFHSVTPLLAEEATVLYILIVMRTIVLYISVQGILAEDPDNTYLKDELELNCLALQKILLIPMDAGITTVLQATGYHKPTVPLSMSLDPPPTSVSIVDMSTLSDLYEPGDWLDSQKSLEILMKEMCKDSQCLAATMYNKVWLCATKIRSLSSPPVMPTFCMIYFPTDWTVSRHSEEFTLKVLLLQAAPIGWINSEVIRLWVKARNIQHYFEIDTHTHTIRIISEANISRGKDYAGFSGTGGFTVLMQVCVNMKHSLDENDVRALTSTDYANYAPLFVSVEDWLVYKHLVQSPLSFISTNSEDKDSSLVNEQALQSRYEHVAKCQEHYYQQPPNIERGYRTFLYDIHGRAYLDMVNNVAIIGHCHERINEAIYKQSKLLNTNSRFIYSALSNYAEEILSHIPVAIRKQKKLNKVFLVNSGSEATDLALRLARVVASERRAWKKGFSYASALDRDVICIQGGYHGITTASDEVSTTLNDNPRSLETRAPWIHLVPMPNLYRGVYRANKAESKEDIALKYADLVRQKIEEMVTNNTPPSAFIAEPLSGNAGGVEIPNMYLSTVYESIRSVGGLCICDEVQVGYGRLGTRFWGFQEHKIVPDIVTMAKAAGNGHPLGFVIVSEDIVDDFYASQGSFFSSAGGGPISCAVGTAVLEVIKQDDLQSNAREVGAYLHNKLLALQQKYADVIGCIHGHGLYQGVELVQKGKNNADGVPLPATKEAYAICERLLELGVINHNTGDYSNVLKIKPPLYFSKEDADFFVEALDHALQGW